LRIMKIAQERRECCWKLMKNKKRSVGLIPTGKKDKLGVKMFFLDERSAIKAFFSFHIT